MALLSGKAVRIGWAVVALAVGVARSAQAGPEWQFKPYGSLVFGGETTFVDLEAAAGDRHWAAGASVTALGEWLGFEGDVAQVPGFFQADGKHLVPQSSVTTVTGNALLAAPRRLVEFTLRPYLAAGGGLVRVNTEDVLGVLRVSETLPVIDVGGGVTGFVNNWVGLNWDLRYFRSIGGSAGASGVSIGDEELRFWRATMGLAIRF